MDVKLVDVNASVSTWRSSARPTPTGGGAGTSMRSPSGVTERSGSRASRRIRAWKWTAPRACISATFANDARAPWRFNALATFNVVRRHSSPDRTFQTT
jgi:hypothetical protein